MPAEYVFCDEGFSGARLDRPALDRLRDLAAEGAFAAVLIYAPDRLARQYAYQVVVLDELIRTGCQVVFLNHAFGTSPEEQMLLQIQGVCAEYERAVIRERTRRGRLFAARQGRVNWGHAPYGYCYLRRTETTPQQLVIQETEATIVRQIYQWLVAEELSSYAIAKRLTEEAVPTRAGQGTGWRQSSVMEILRDPLYKGEGYFNRTQTVEAHRPYRGRGYKDCRPGNGRGRAERPRGVDPRGRSAADRCGNLGGGADAIGAQSGARAPQQHQTRLLVARLGGRWALWAADDWHLECERRPLCVWGPLSAARAALL